MYNIPSYHILPNKKTTILDLILLDVFPILTFGTTITVDSKNHSLTIKIIPIRIGDMKKSIKAVVLAAGKSKRMKSDYSKITHKILGKEIINFLLDSLVESGITEQDIIVVTSTDNEHIKDIIKKKVKYAIQKQPLGTAHALLSAQQYIKTFNGDCLVIVGDNPYITSQEINKLIKKHQTDNYHCTLISAVFPDKPPPYGRIIRDRQKKIIDVVEEIEASKKQLKIREVNSSIYMFDNAVVFPLLGQINNHNEKKEYYLTDIIKILKQKKLNIGAVIADDYMVSIGINNRWELQAAQQQFNRKNLQYYALEKGVTIHQPETVTIEYNVEIGKDTVIFPSTYIAAGTKIGPNCRIGPFVFLKNVQVPGNSRISFEKRINAKQ